MQPIQGINAKEWNALRTKLNTLIKELAELKGLLPRALDKNFVQRQIDLKRKEIKEIKDKTEPKL